MKPTHNIENSIKNLHITPSAKMLVRTRDDILQAHRNSKRTKSLMTQPNTWRTITKTRITKLAAVVIIITVVIGLQHFTGSSMDGAAVALGQIRQALDKVKYIKSESYKKDEYLGTSWSGSGIYCKKKTRSSFCVYVTSDPDRRLEYSPKTKIITISWPGDGYSAAYQTPLQTIKRKLDHHLKYAGKTETSTGKLNGQEVDVVSIYGTKEDANEVVMMWCDPMSHLPLKIHRRDFTTTYSFPQEAPDDIYELGAPRSATVISTVPSEKVQKLLNRFFKSRKSALKYENMQNMFGYLTPTRTGQIIQNEYAQKHGLICLEEFIQGQMLSESEVLSLPGRRLYFFDSKKDYMWVRREEYVVPQASWQIDKNWRSEDLPGITPRHTIIDILEFSQDKDGVWFPVKVREYSANR